MYITYSRTRGYTYNQNFRSLMWWRRSLAPGLLWLAAFLARPCTAESSGSNSDGGKGGGGDGGGRGGDNGKSNSNSNSNSGSGSVWATPHEQYSSSAGVLGCKIDTNRVAYWPGAVDCDNVCVSVSREGRSVRLLRIDTSEGAHDISYDAWNYLYTGYGAAEQPATGGPVAVDYQYVDPAECADLLRTDGRGLPLSAPTGTNLLVACLDGRPDSWLARNHVLYNIIDAVCTWGHDETCDLDYPAANQASCPHTLGVLDNLTDTPVYNIQYGTGKTVLASSGQVVDGQPNGGDSDSGGGGGGGDESVGSQQKSLPLNGAVSDTFRLWSLLGLAAALQCLLFSLI